MKLSPQKRFVIAADLVAWALLFLLLLLLGLLGELRGQTPPGRAAPHLGYVYPAGAQQGATLTLSVGGQALNGASTAYFAGGGLEARVTGYDRPLTQKEINDLREKLQQLQDKRAAQIGWTDDDQKTMAEIRAKLALRPARAVSPALAETVTLELAVAPGAAPGERELRLKTPAGLSNPIIFWVGPLPEFSEPVVTATSNPPPRGSRPNEPRASGARADPVVPLPAVINGQILPGEVDRFRFTARKDQRLTIAAGARALLPYLADAVPGWFQATLAIRDAQGRELAYIDDHSFHPDPMLSFAVPADGNYTVEIKDALYRGREDFVYRITIGELPFVRNIFPLGGRVGGEATFAVAGWNLPGHLMTVDTKDKLPGTFQLSPRDPVLPSNFVRFGLDTLPECFEIEPIATQSAAQPIELPMIVNGRIGHAGDEDVFAFAGRAGTIVVAEVVARRLGSPLDSLLTLTDSAGRQLASNDDFEDKAAGLLTHQSDSRLSVTLPADDSYRLVVRDAQHRGGTEFSYRLRVSAPRPDFELRVVPATLNVRAGASVPLTVYVVRRDGFAGDIRLALPGAPAGFVLSGGGIPAGQDRIDLTLTAPPAARDEPIVLTMAGSATIAGQTVTRAAVPAEDLMQAFAYRHLVPAKQLSVALTGRGATFRVLTPLPLRIPAGESARVRVALPNARFAGNATLELHPAIAGMGLTPVVAPAGVVEVAISCDPAKLPPGTRGNLILNVTGEPAPTAKQNNARTTRTTFGTVPAIPFEIMPPAEPPGL